MMQYRNREQGRGTAPVRSAFMRTEEIERERRESGWNPYEGEEEAEDFSRAAEDRDRAEDFYGRNADRDQTEDFARAERDALEENEESLLRPFFTQPDFAQVMEEQMRKERDLRALQAMYPEAAKLLLPLIEEECDKMEYEGSAMFDSYPDQTTIWQLQERIREAAQQQLSQDAEEEVISERIQDVSGMRRIGSMQDAEEIAGTQRVQDAQGMAGTQRVQDAEGMPAAEVFSMQYQGRRRGRPGQDWLGDMIRVMLLQEMHHRRCRHQNCRSRY